MFPLLLFTSSQPHYIDIEFEKAFDMCKLHITNVVESST
jgi:hypothetical protein